MRVSLILPIAVCLLSLHGDRVCAQMTEGNKGPREIVEMSPSLALIDDLQETLSRIESRSVKVEGPNPLELLSKIMPLSDTFDKDSRRELGIVMGRCLPIAVWLEGIYDEKNKKSFGAPKDAILEAYEKSPVPYMLPYLGRTYVDTYRMNKRDHEPKLKEIADFFKKAVGEVPQTYNPSSCEMLIPMAEHVRFAERILAERQRPNDALIAQVSEIDFTKPSSPNNNWATALGAIYKNGSLKDPCNDPYAVHLATSILERLPKEDSTEVKINNEKNGDAKIKHRDGPTVSISRIRKSCEYIIRKYNSPDQKSIDRARYEKNNSVRRVKGFMVDIEYNRMRPPLQYDDLRYNYESEIHSWSDASLILLQKMYHDAQTELNRFLEQSPSTPYSQWQAVRLMGRMIDVNTTPTLISIIEAPDVCPLTMREGMIALAEIGGNDVQSYLLSIIDRPLPDSIESQIWSHPELERRASAAEALGHYADETNYKEIDSKLQEIARKWKYSGLVCVGSVRGRDAIASSFGRWF